MSSRFPGFSPEAIRFLRALERNNRRDWFQPRKEQFETQLRDPMLALVAELNSDLAKYAPQYVTDPKKAVFRIYRDTRFSADKSPYKTNISAVFHARGGQAGGLYFSVSAKQVEIAGGVYHPDRDVLLAVRQHIVAHHAELQRLLAAPKTRKLCGELKGEELSRPPKGFDPEHPAIDWIKKKDWVFDAALDAAIATTPQLYDEIATRFRAMHPVVEFLNRPLSARKSRIEPEPF